MSHDPTYFRKPAHKHTAIVTAVLVVVLLLVVGACGVLVFDGLKTARTVQGSIQEAQAAVLDRDLAQAGEHLADASISLRRLRARLQVLRVLQVVPVVGSQVDSMYVILEEAEQSIDIVRTLVRIGIDVESHLRAIGYAESVADLTAFRELSPEARFELVLALQRAIPDLEEAQARLSQQRKALDDLDDRSLFLGLRMARSALKDRIEVLEETLDVFVPIVNVLPEVGGFERTQRYLLVLQNSGELRPTGGFWGTYGVMTVQDGEIVDITTDDVYAVDRPAEGRLHVTPPAPLRRYLGVESWWLRDANWDPDVPTSAQRGLAFYAAQVNASDNPTAPRVAFDGVIMVNPDLASKLLVVLGSVAIGDIFFEPDSFFDVLEYEVEQGFVLRGIDRDDRKDVVGSLLDVLLDRMREADADTIAQLFSVTQEALENNDILVYSQNDVVQQMLVRQGWDGSLRVPAEHDYLMVVDANLAALKTDTVVDRSYTYTIHRDLDGDLIARVRIDYDHTTPDFDFRTTRYRTYTRVYAPLGSELIEVQGSLQDDLVRNPSGVPGAVDTYTEHGATVFGTFTAVEPAASGSLEFVYQLPDHVRDLVDDGRYTLDVQRQPGVGQVPLTLSLDFDKELTGARPGEAPDFWYDDTYTYTTTAVPRQQFDLRF